LGHFILPHHVEDCIDPQATDSMAETTFLEHFCFILCTWKTAYKRNYHQLRSRYGHPLQTSSELAANELRDIVSLTFDFIKIVINTSTLPLILNAI